MPSDAPNVKVAAVQRWGATVDLVDVRKTSRETRCAELMETYPDAYLAHPSDDDFVIAGNTTLGRELAGLHHVDAIVAPIGGGGLTSGIIAGLAGSGSRVSVYGAEPLNANDAARSFRAQTLIANDCEPTTIADGVRAMSIGKRNWPILRNGLAGVIEVSEEQIVVALQLLFRFAHLKAEPAGAVSLAALLASPTSLRDRTTCCVVTGANIDTSTFMRLLKTRPNLP